MEKGVECEVGCSSISTATELELTRKGKNLSVQLRNELEPIFYNEKIQ